MFVIARSLATPSLLVSPGTSFVPTHSAICQAKCLRPRTPDHHRVSTCDCIPHDGSTSMVTTVRCRTLGQLQHFGRTHPKRWLSLAFRTTFATAFQRVLAGCLQSAARCTTFRELLGWNCACDTSSTRSCRSPPANCDGRLWRVWICEKLNFSNSIGSVVANVFFHLWRLPLEYLNKQTVLDSQVAWYLLCSSSCIWLRQTLCPWLRFRRLCRTLERCTRTQPH